MPSYSVTSGYGPQAYQPQSPYSPPAWAPHGHAHIHTANSPGYSSRGIGSPGYSSGYSGLPAAQEHHNGGADAAASRQPSGFGTTGANLGLAADGEGRVECKVLWPLAFVQALAVALSKPVCAAIPCSVCKHADCVNCRISGSCDLTCAACNADCDVMLQGT